MVQKALLNKQTMIDLLGNDDDSIQYFRLQFVEQSEAILPELLEYLESGCFDKLQLKAHFLKTSAKAVGAEMTADSLYQLELSANAQDPKTSAMIMDSLLLLHTELKAIILESSNRD